ncbi:MAG TPA: NAD(P)H-binding protein, partial [Candidatus Saccharimonadales bacterium]
MKIAVLAANGRTGKVFVEQALAAGHSVNAGIYGTNNLPPHKNLTIVSCDATRDADVTRLLQAQDAVVSFIGHIKGSPPSVQTNAMHTLTKVMKKLQIKRIVSLTGTGVRFPGDKITLLDRVLNLAVSIIDPARVTDGREHVEVLQESGLDWTVIRVLKLQNVVPKPFKLTEHGPTKWYVGREEVAQAALEVL